MVRRHEARPEGALEWMPKPPWPMYMVVSAPEDAPLTPDDLVIQPAATKEEVGRLWEFHDGRTAGTMVVAVYKFDPDSADWVRDREWGMLGDVRKTGPANPDDERHTL